MRSITVLIAFYSKGRNKFLPLLTDEVSRRAKLAEDETRKALHELEYNGAVTKSTTAAKLTIWELSETGARLAKKLIEKQELERSR